MQVTMNMGNIDSCQNGMAAAFSSYLFKSWKNSLLWTRAFVFLVNIPLVVLATKNYSVLEVSVVVKASLPLNHICPIPNCNWAEFEWPLPAYLQLFLLIMMLASCSVFPLLLGLVKRL